jgi:hypothetical protein
MSQLSFDLSQITERQVLDLFTQFLKEQSSALEIFLRNGQKYNAGTNNKYEWMESQLTPMSWQLNGAITPLVTNTNFTFVSTAGLRPNMILRFVTTSTNGDVGNVQVKIVSITSATVAVGVLYGGTTAVALNNTMTAKLMSEAVQENEKNIVGVDERQPTMEFNFFQIFRNAVELSDTALNSAVYGNVNTLAEQLKGAFYKMRQQLSEQVLRGRRVARTSGENGTFGGMFQYLDVAGGNVIDAGGAALSQALINNLVQLIIEDGGVANTIVCNINQARKISGFNVAGNNPVIAQNSTDAGSYVLRFISDIPVAGGVVSNILLDEKMPNNGIQLIDINRMALVPYQNRGVKLVPGTQPGQDGQTAILRGEYSMVVRDAKYSHGIIKNILP